MIIDVAEVGQRTVRILPGLVVDRLRLRVAMEQLLEGSLRFRRDFRLRMAGLVKHIAVMPGGECAGPALCCGRWHPTKPEREEQCQQPPHFAKAPTLTVKPFSGLSSASRNLAQKSVAPPPLTTAARTTFAPLFSVM